MTLAKQKSNKMLQQDTILKLFHRLKKYNLLILISLIMAAITVASSLYVPILIGNVIDYITLPGQVNLSAITPILFKVGIVVGITGISQWIMNRCNNRITYHVTRDVRNEAMEKIEVLPLRYIDEHAYGDVVSRVIADVDQFADGLLLGFTQFFTGVITIAGTLGFMFSIHAGIAMIVVCLTPVSLFVAKYIATHTYEMFRLQSKTRGEQTALIEEMISGQNVVKAFSYEEEALKRFGEINGRLQNYSLKAIFYSSITNPSTRFVNSIVYAGVALGGAFAVVSGRLTIGQLSCFLSYANQYTKPFNEISGVITELQNAIACAVRIFELVEAEPQPSEAADAVELTKVSGNVTLEQVNFSYDASKPLIRNLNLSVKPGQRIAIVGPTGCGKTTLINLLMRFYDVNSGKIAVDDMDIQRLTRKSLREAYGMVLQDTWIRTGTIRDNITLGNTEFTEEEIIRAAKEAHSYSFIKRMLKGLDTYITEDGGGLSQGQKQLLCITRVMLHLPPMLILDEATSSIDTRTELKVQNAFTKLMEGKTSFIVAHRLSTIQSADIILVMRDGNIIEQGNHEELMKKQGFYAELYRSQFAQ